MPPAFRNNLGPTASDNPAFSAAFSLFNPAAIPCQNSSCSARPATGGRPKDPSFARVDRFFRMPIATSASEVLRRPIDSASGLPCAMVLTVYSALSLVIGLSCHHRRQLVLAGLISASRYRDHAASPSAFGAFVSCTARVHRIPHPTFVTIAKRPS